MELLLAAIVGALATAVIGFLLVAPAEADRHDHQIEEADRDLEEWIIDHHRQLVQRLREIQQQAIAQGVERGGSIPAGHAAARTLVLYEYRDQLRRARSLVREIEVQERWPHRLYRRLRRRPIARLTTPDRAARVIDYWEEGTGRNALTWSLEDLIADLPLRAASRAEEPS